MELQYLIAQLVLLPNDNYLAEYILFPPLLRYECPCVEVEGASLGEQGCPITVTPPANQCPHGV